MAMKDPQLGTIYLSEYEAPRFLIDKTVLCIDVREDDAKVLATLSMRRNPESKYRGKDLDLSGQELALQSVSIDGHQLSADEYTVTSENLIIHQVPDQFEQGQHLSGRVV